MKFVVDHEIVAEFVKLKGQHAVQIANHLAYVHPSEIMMWEKILDKIHEPEIKFNLVHGGVFFFDELSEAEQFFKIFVEDGCMNSNLHAVLYRNDGEYLTNNFNQ